MHDDKASVLFGDVLDERYDVKVRRSSERSVGVLSVVDERSGQLVLQEQVELSDQWEHASSGDIMIASMLDTGSMSKDIGRWQQRVEHLVDVELAEAGA